jgi:hypothetical protein
MAIVRVTVRTYKDTDDTVIGHSLECTGGPELRDGCWECPDGTMCYDTGPDCCPEEWVPIETGCTAFEIEITDGEITSVDAVEG